MPPIETIDRYTKAVLWEFDGYDNRGDYTVNGPREVTVRWMPVSREATDAQGNPIKIAVDIIAAEQIEIGGVMWKGSLSSLPALPSPLFQIVSHEEAYDLKGRNIQYSASLTSYRGTLPDTVGTGS